MPRLPGLRKVDLRAEAVYTDAPNGENGGHYVYFDSFYHTCTQTREHHRKLDWQGGNWISGVEHLLDQREE